MFPYIIFRNKIWDINMDVNMRNQDFDCTHIKGDKQSGRTKPRLATIKFLTCNNRWTFFTLNKNSNVLTQQLARF